MSIVHVAFPVTRIKLRLTLYKGQPWSVIEHIILESLTRHEQSLRQLANGFVLPKPIVEESLMRLMRMGWVRMAALPTGGLRFWATHDGVVAASYEYLPYSPRPVKRERWQLFDRLVGHAFRVGDLTHLRRTELKAHPRFDDMVIMPPQLSEGVFRPDELVDVALDEDEQLLGVEPSGEHATDRLALVKVVDGEIHGMPADRALPLLEEAIHRAAVDAGGKVSRAATRSRGVPEPRPPTAVVHRIRFETGDLLVGGDAHREALEGALETAKTRVIIHSTFLAEDKFRSHLPLMLKAVKRGVTIDVLWGQEPRDGNAKTKSRPTAAETVRLLLQDPQIVSHRDRLRIHPECTRSHIKVIVVDLRSPGDFVALVGSCNWLSSPFRAIEASIYLRDACIVREVLRCLMRVVHAGGGIWPTLATELYQLSQMLPDNAIARPANANASLVMGDAHNAYVLRARDEVRHKLLLTSNRLGRHCTVGALIPLAKVCIARHIDANLIYSLFEDITRAEASQFEKEAAANKISLRPKHNPQLHAKLLAWDENNAVITSQNWLSADPADARLAREMGVALESPGIATLLMGKFGECMKDAR